MQQKGVAIKSTLAAVEKLYGAAAHIEVIESLPEEIRAQISPVLPVQWYPIGVTAAVHLVVRDRIGGGSWESSHAIGVEAARIDFTGIYRMFLRAVQYDTILERMERAWSHYNSQGRIVWHDRSAGTMAATISGVDGFNPGIWQAIAGRAQGLLQLSGAKGASVTTRDMTTTSGRIEGVWFD